MNLKDIQKPKAFIAIIRGKGRMKLDEDEVSQVIAAWKSKEGTVVRQGFINGNDVANIEEDTERISEYMSKCRDVISHNDWDMQYGDGNHQKPIPEFKLLPNVFQGVNLKKHLKIQKGDNLPILGGGHFSDEI